MTTTMSPGRGESIVMDSQQPRPGNTTPAEDAILRSWLGGNPITDIAKARRTTQDVIAATINDLCGFDRGHGRRVLNTGARLPLPRPTAPAGPPTAWTAALADAERRATQLAAVVDDLRRQLVAARAELEQRPIHLTSYGALWCQACRQVVSSGHPHPAQAVTVAVLARSAS